MLKKAFVLSLVAVFLLMMAGNAWAAGWWRENVNDTINVLAGNGADTYNGVWSAASDNSTATSPHGQFSTTTNKCKTCHAVHGALSDSFRLLRNNNREDECNYCHWKASGASKYRLYAYTDLGKTVRGEHTLGSTVVPDSSLAAVPDRGTYGAGGAPTLYCFSCHSVHGAYTLENVGADAGWWTQRILRSDPGKLGGGYDAGNGLNCTNVTLLGYGCGLTQDVQGGGSIALPSMSDLGAPGSQARKNMVRAAFCAGCHTKNFNYRQNQANGQDYSLQRGSHPLNTDGTLEVGGGAGVSGIAQVSWVAANWCGSCHAAPIELGGVTSDSAVAYAGGQGTDQNAGYGGFDWNTTWYAAGFPHQSESNKLLFDSVKNGADVAGITNDAYRAVDGMDEVCAKCHTDTGTWSGATAGPSKTF